MSLVISATTNGDKGGESADGKAASAPPKAAASKKDTTNDPNSTRDDDSSSRTLDDIELDEINRNPMMLQMLQTIDILHKSVTPPDAANLKMPAWMGELLLTLTDPTSHINHRLVVAKLVINRPAVFEPYAKDFWRGLAQLAINTSSEGEGINYMVQDICNVLIIWSTKQVPDANSDNRPDDDEDAVELAGGNATMGATPGTRDPKNKRPPVWQVLRPENTDEDKEAASKLLSYLMSNMTSGGTRAVLRMNLEIVKGLCENWKDILEVDTSALYRQLTRTTKKDEKDNMVGIQLLGVIVANQMVPYIKEKAGGVREDDFWSKLVANLGFKHSETYASAAEVCGMVLKQALEDPALYSVIDIVENQIKVSRCFFLFLFYHMFYFFIFARRRTSSLSSRAPNRRTATG